jgi:hypothetical protein
MGLLIGIGQTRPQSAFDYWYGIEWDVTVSNPHPTRIGKGELHKSLPLQNLMRGCTLKDDGTVNYYLHANDSTKRDNGAAANLTGADGQVMVELPDVYVRFEMDGNKRRALISPQALPGFHLWKKDYISMYEASVQRSTTKLCSVVNMDADYRGGGNNSGWDGTYHTLLGRPVTSISLTKFRTYARKRGSVGWNCNVYSIHRKVWWLFAIEYCTFNSQETFNAELTSEGYHQGGLGSGVTTIEGGKWDTFNGHNPFIPCGYTNSLGNHTGYVEFTMPTEYNATATKVQVNRYRGIELPFGHLWKWTDGCKCMIQSEADGGLSQFYVADDPASYNSSGVSGYELRGNLPRKDGYVKEVILGEYGEIMPLAVGGGSTTYFCDYFYTKIPASGTSESGVLFGGLANDGATAGFVYACARYPASDSNANIGSRLCFIPQIEAA